MKPVNHIPGKVRYLTKFVHFPDKDTWVRQTHFCQPLDNFLLNTQLWRQFPHVVHSLLNTGEASFKPGDGTWQQYLVEEEPRAEKWGIERRPA